MRDVEERFQTYQDFNNSKKNPAVYQDGKDHISTSVTRKTSEREYWLQDAIARYRNDPGVKCFNYNNKVHTVHIFANYEPGKIINARNYVLMEKKTGQGPGGKSTRHVNRTFVIFD